HESHHRYVVYQGESKEPAWLARCLRQADRVVVAARAADDPSPRDVERLLQGRSDVHLVLLHPDRTERPSGTAAWLAGRNLRLHHPGGLGGRTEGRRRARIVGGVAVGVAGGGGGAGGVVHPGVWRAFLERGIGPEALGGTGMGAAGSGLAALGGSPDAILGLGARL